MDFENFEDWLEQASPLVTQDPLWEFVTYRKALFLADLAWFDSERLLAEPRAKSIAWQMVRSAGSVAAKIEEGFGRGYSRDYARFLRVALGSARETKRWYYRTRHNLHFGEDNHDSKKTSF